MATPRRSGEAWDWRQIADLGDQLLGENSLLAQRDRIEAMASRLVSGAAELWLNENLFRLPDWDSKRHFSPQPTLKGMRLAVRARRLVTGNLPGESSPRGTFAALPLEDQGLILGALQISRPQGPKFGKEERELLEGLARIGSVGLFASHRVDVERFRLGQLNLVRDVSAQIANVLDVDELARRVTELIRQTFRYYYVAIFTRKPGSDALRFRSSASAPRRGKKKAAIALEVDVGEGLIGEAAASGKQIVCEDVRSDPRYRFIDSLPETRSEAVIPLKIEDRVLGVLDIQSNQKRAFHPNDLLILEALAGSVARAVEGARLYGDVRRRADQLALIAEVSKSVTSTLNLADLMQEAAALIHARFRYSQVALFTVHPKRRVIEFEAGSGPRTPRLAGFMMSLDDVQGIIPWVARAGETELANDVAQDVRYVPSQILPRSTASELTVPLKYQDRVVGVLDIQSNRRNAFSDDDRLMFEAVGDTIAAAIRNADLFHSEQWRRQVSDSLREVAGLLSSNAGVEQVLGAILAQLERNLPVDAAAIWLMNEDRLVLAAINGMDAATVEEVRSASPEASAALLAALESRTPLIRMRGDPMMPVALAAGFDDAHSSLIAPMRLSDQTLVLITLSHHSAGRYGHEAQAMTTTFASYAAVAIENARLYDAAQEQAYAAAALLQVAQAVVSLGSLDEILESIIRILPILVGIRRAVLFLWETEREAFLASQDFGLSAAEASLLMGREFAAGSFPLLEAARLQGRMVARPLKAKASARSWIRVGVGPLPAPLDDPDFLQAENRLLIAVPLSIKNDVYGVMMLEEAEGGRRFRARRIEIIQGIAQQAALAIQDDRLQQQMVVRERLETEMQLARQVQQTFIPDALPEFAGWDLATRWQTARQVGGDFFDVFELPNRQIGLFIGDVADKGMPAALFMALTRTLVRAAVLGTDSPAAALRSVNDLLYPDTQQGMFVTGVYAVLDIETGRLAYANAGHNPPLWLQAAGTVERLGRTGVALGAVEKAEISERVVHVSPGDLLLFYTDGLTEAESETGAFFGEQRLLEGVQASKLSSADELLKKVESHLDAFTDPLPRADDLTLLALKRI